MSGPQTSHVWSYSGHKTQAYSTLEGVASLGRLAMPRLENRLTCSSPFFRHNSWLTWAVF